MYSLETVAILRSILDETCASISQTDTPLRTHVAVRLLEAARARQTSIEELRLTARRALSEASKINALQ
jgi:hypothetical protein